MTGVKRKGQGLADYAIRIRAAHSGDKDFILNPAPLLRSHLNSTTSDQKNSRGSAWRLPSLRLGHTVSAFAHQQIGNG